MAESKTKKEKSDVIVYTAGTKAVELSPELIRKYLVSGKHPVTNEEIMLFLALCRYQGLNPWLREAYLIKYSAGDPAAMVVGKSTYERRAAHLDNFDGIEAGVIIKMEDGSIEDRKGARFYGEPEQLLGAWANVHLKNRKIPVNVSVTFNEYAGRTQNGDLNRFWSKKPATMIVKVAKVQALREAFPDDFVGMYDATEIPAVGDPDALPTEEVTIVEPTESKPVATEAPDDSGAEASVVGDAESVQPDGDGGGETVEPESDAPPTASKESKKTEPDITEDQKKCEEIAGKILNGMNLMLRDKLMSEEEFKREKQKVDMLVEGGAVEFMKDKYNEIKALYNDRTSSKK